MLFGEYLVLKGANCLAFPLKYGQKLSVEPSDNFVWESYQKGSKWFQLSMDRNFKILATNEPSIAETIKRLMLIIRKYQPEIDFNLYFKIEADFNLSWGFGSSSTLVSLLSQWSGVASYTLLDESFGGSGYDLACTKATKPIIYANHCIKKEVELPEVITDKILFVYFGIKQNSRNEIKRFDQRIVTNEDILKMNIIIENCLISETIKDFEEQINEAEELVENIIGFPKIKSTHFIDYPHSVKYLGAWGGDFFMATYRNLDEAKKYFKQKGFKTQFTYNELVK